MRGVDSKSARGAGSQEASTPPLRRRLERERLLETLFAASPDAVFFKDADCRWLEANGPARALFQVEGLAFEGLSEPEIAEYSPTLRSALHTCAESDEATWARGAPLQLEEHIPRPDGSLGIFEVSKLPLFHPDGSRKGLVVIARDITARRQAEQERDRLLLQEQAARSAAEAAERRASLLAAASRVLVGTLDPASALAQVARLMVPGLAEVCRIELTAAVVPAGTPVLAEAHASAPWATALQGEVPLLCRARAAALSVGGAVIQEAAAAAAPARPFGPAVRAALVVPLRAHGQLLGTLALLSGTAGRYGAAEQGLAEDLAQRISLAVENARLFRELKASHDSLAQAQQELVRRERLAALGELAAVVAHEVRNPLGVIFNSLATLRRTRRTPEEAATLFGVMEEEASRLSRLVADLLDFARPYELKLQEASLVEIASEALSSALRAHGESSAVSVTTRVDPAIPRIQVDRGLMHLALLNVLSNALQAMPEGGTLLTALRTVEEGARRHVELTVSDSGAGIPEHLLQRIFEPFFTTRSAGTGLGLSIVKRIVESHAGTLEVASVVGRGTTVTVRLPLAA